MKSVSTSLDLGNILHASFQVSEGALNFARSFELVPSSLDHFRGCKLVFKSPKNTSLYFVILI